MVLKIFYHVRAWQFIDAALVKNAAMPIEQSAEGGLLDEMRGGGGGELGRDKDKDTDKVLVFMPVP